MIKTIPSAFTPAAKGTTIPVITSIDLIEIEDNLSSISSDSILSKAEKSSVILEYNKLLAQYNSLVYRASLLGDGQIELDALNSAKTSLDTYLTTIIPAWDDVTQHSPIDPTIYKEKWTDVYNKIEILQIALSGSKTIRDTTPPPEAPIGTEWIDPITNHRYLFSGSGGITLGGVPITVGGLEVIPSGYISVQDSDTVNALELSTLNKDSIDEAFDALSLLVADGILSVTEKIQVLIPRNSSLEAMYSALSSAATALGISYTTVTAARLSWNNLLASLSPEWNDTTRQTAVDRDSFRDILNTYEEELEQLSGLISEIASISLSINIPTINIKADYLGNPKDGQLPISISPLMYKGSNIVNSFYTWTMTLSPTLTATQNTTAADSTRGSVTLTGISGDGTINISAAGKNIACRVSLLKDAPPTTSSTISTYPSVSSTLFPSNPPTIASITVPSSGSISFDAYWEYGGSDYQLEGKHVYRVSGSSTWTDVATASAGTYSYAGTSYPTEPTPETWPGIWSENVILSGLTVGATIEWGLMLRKLDGGASTGVTGSSVVGAA